MKKVIIFVVLLIALSSGAYAIFAPTCGETVGTSPEAPAHMHTWCSNQEFTEDFCNAEGKCHRHTINMDRNLAEAAGFGPHTHNLR